MFVLFLSENAEVSRISLNTIIPARPSPPQRRITEQTVEEVRIQVFPLIFLNQSNNSISENNPSSRCSQDNRNS